MGLNTDQIAAITKLRQFLNSDQRMATLTGCAGTGKTYTLAKFMKQALALQKLGGDAPPRTLLTAPTHKAVAVLSAMLGLDFPAVDSATIQSALGLYLTSDGEYKQLVASGRSRLHEYDLVIVDEGSMVNDVLEDHIKKAMGGEPVSAWNYPAGRSGKAATKVLFMGDILQLPPVKGTVSPVFQYTICTLNIQMRQEEGNPIGRAIALMRQQAEKGRFLKQSLETSINENGDGLHVMPGNAFRDKVVEMFGKDAHHSKLIAWTNAEVEKWNSIIRQELHPGAAEVFVGEYLNVQQPVTVSTSERGLTKKNIVFHSDQEIRVEQCTSTTLGEMLDNSQVILPRSVEHGLDIVPRKLPMYHILGRSDETQSTAWFPAVSLAHQDVFRRFMSKVSSAAKKGDISWKDYWGVVDSFIPIRYTYATTVHKSQGSSYDNVAVVLTNVLKNTRLQELTRLLYVAFSRARKNVVVDTSRTWAMRAK